MRKLDCILLVDDDEITNFVNEELIRSQEAAEEVLVATNGRKAIDLIRQQVEEEKAIPNLILLDINMPVMNGFEFLDAYQGLEKDIQQSVIIIMLTSSLNPRDMERLNDGSNADFMDKPLTEQKLKMLMQKHFP